MKSERSINQCEPGHFRLKLDVWKRELWGESATEGAGGSGAAAAGGRDFPAGGLQLWDVMLLVKEKIKKQKGSRATAT